MNDPAKYIKLFWMLILAMAAFIIAFILLFLGIRLVFGLVNQIPWITYIYTLFILSVPAAIFISAFSVFILRSRNHVSRPVKLISFLLLGVFLCTWIVFYVTDAVRFFSTSNTEVLLYKSWNLIFLTSSVACLFIVGIIQALSAAKEEDWLDRNRRINP